MPTLHQGLRTSGLTGSKAHKLTLLVWLKVPPPPGKHAGSSIHPSRGLSLWELLLILGLSLCLDLDTGWQVILDSR